MIAGLGCRQGVAADAVLRAIDAALLAAARSRAELRGLATVPRRAGHAGLHGAAGALGLPLLLPEAAALHEAAARCITRSTASLAATALPSAAEAAALAAAGPASRLLAPRMAHDGVTCALAEAAP
jgi:cobalt-precorrin 5A hydrolase